MLCHHLSKITQFCFVQVRKREIGENCGYLCIFTHSTDSATNQRTKVSVILTLQGEVIWTPVLRCDSLSNSKNVHWKRSLLIDDCQTFGFFSCFSPYVTESRLMVCFSTCWARQEQKRSKQIFFFPVVDHLCHKNPSYLFRCHHSCRGQCVDWLNNCLLWLVQKGK